MTDGRLIVCRLCGRHVLRVSVAGIADATHAQPGDRAICPARDAEMGPASAAAEAAFAVGGWPAVKEIERHARADATRP